VVSAYQHPFSTRTMFTPRRRRKRQYADKRLRNMKAMDALSCS
jgi:hypothetical protein